MTIKKQEKEIVKFLLEKGYSKETALEACRELVFKTSTDDSSLDLNMDLVAKAIEEYGKPMQRQIQKQEQPKTTVALQKKVLQFPALRSKKTLKSIIAAAIIGSSSFFVLPCQSPSPDYTNSTKNINYPIEVYKEKNLEDNKILPYGISDKDIEELPDLGKYALERYIRSLMK
jgi:hypothetical protein